MFVMCLFLFAHIIETFKLLMPLSKPNITQQVYMYFVCSIQQHSVCFPSAAFNTITTLEELLMPALSPNFLSGAVFEFCDLLTVLTVHRRVKVKGVYLLGYLVHRSTFRTLIAFTSWACSFTTNQVLATVLVTYLHNIRN